jgi:hypothetical protein
MGIANWVAQAEKDLVKRGARAASTIGKTEAAAAKSASEFHPSIKAVEPSGGGPSSRPSVPYGSVPYRGAQSIAQELPAIKRVETGAAPSAVDATKGGGFSEAMKALGITNPSSALGTAGLLGGMALYSGNQAQKAQEQGQAMVGQEKAIAQPYQIQGREMAQQALAGDMTPATQQAYKAAQAQIQQNVATSGGVGQQQAGIQLEAFRQQLLQNQYQYGIQVSQIGDNIALGAIQDSMQLNQNLNSISNSFYSNLGNIAAMSMGNYNPYGLQQPQTINR